MTLELYGHRFSSYTQKALIAFYENETPFDFMDLEEPANNAALERLWPMKRFPILVDGERTILEATGVIEHLAAVRPGPVALVPGDAAAAVEVRMLDRVFDNYVGTPQGDIVVNAIRPAEARDAYGEAQSRAMLETAYAWLDQRMASRQWACGEAFTMADCAAAPHLFYADWTHRIADRFAALKAYRARLLARPSFARCVDDARPHRSYFPLGAPQRD